MKKFRIVFIGSDGSGKSALIKYVKKKLEKAGKDVDVFFMGWRDFRNPLLNFFSRFYMKRKSKRGIKEEKLARFRERSWLFYFIYYSELWLRYLKILASRKEYNLIDRYFFDELAFAKGIKFKLFKIFTPKPDICFLLEASNAVLRKRGVLITEERLKNFYNSMYALSKTYPIIKIDSSNPLNNTYERIKSILNAYK